MRTTPERTIGTKFVVEGEKEYRNQLTNINSDLKTLKSTLSLIDSEFAKNSNSLEALSAKNKALSDIYDKQKEKLATLKNGLDLCRKAHEKQNQVVQEAKQKLDDANDELKKLQNSSEDTTDAQEKLKEEIKKLEDELSKQQSKLDASSRKVNKWQTDCNYAEKQLNELSHELEENAAAMKKAEQATNDTGDSFKDMGEKTSDAADLLADALVASGVIKTLKELKDAIIYCTNASTEFESAITGVHKTVDGTEEQLAAISDEIKEMSLEIPSTASEISAVGEAAGQLGIATEDVTSFSRTIIDLGNSTDLTNDSAASMLAQFANITRLDPSNYQRLGSTIVALGNSSATTESKIVDMAQGFASSATAANMSQTGIMGVAASIASLGFEADAGASAIGKTINRIHTAVETGGSDLTDLANIAGVTSEEFQKAWREDAAAALDMFVSGLSDTERHGKSVTVMLQELEINETRQQNVLKALATSNGILNKSLKAANQAWEENTALTNEASKRYETTESKAKIFKNSVNLLAIAVGDVLNPAIKRAYETGTNITETLTEIVEKNPWVVSAITSITTALGVFAGSMLAVAAAIKVAQKAMEALNSVGNASKWIALASAIASVTAGILVYASTARDDGVKSTKELTEATREAEDAINEVNTTCAESLASIDATSKITNDYIKRLEELEMQGLKTKDAHNEYEGIVYKLNELIPDLNVSIDEQTGLIAGGTEALRINAAMWKENAKAQAYQEKYQEIYSKQLDIELELQTNRELLNASTAEANRLEDERQETFTQLAVAMGVSTTTLKNFTAEQWQQYLSGSKSNDKIRELNQTYRQLGLDIETCEEQQDNLTEAIEINEDALSNAEEQTDRTGRAINYLSGATTDYSDANEELSETLTNTESELAGISVSLNEAEEALSTLTNETINDLNQQMGVFDVFTSKTEEGTTKLIENVNEALDSQISFMSEYSSNLQNVLSVLGDSIDANLLDKLTDGTEESGQLLAAMVAGGDEKIRELNDKFKNVSEGKNNFAAEIAAAKLGFDTEMSEIEDRLTEAVDNFNQETESYRNGSQTIQGYIDGVLARINDVKSAFRRVAAAGQYAVKEENDQHSPSRKYFDIAVNDWEGAILGAKSKENDYKMTYAGIAKSGASAYSESFENQIESAKSKLVPASFYRQSEPKTTASQNNSKTVNQTLNIYADSASPAEIARRIRNATRELLLSI